MVQVPVEKCVCFICIILFFFLLSFDYLLVALLIADLILYETYALKILELLFLVLTLYLRFTYILFEFHFLIIQLHSNFLSKI